jgi:hypothetical protein
MMKRLENSVKFCNLQVDFLITPQHYRLGNKELWMVLSVGRTIIGFTQRKWCEGSREQLIKLDDKRMEAC